ncbi:DUF2505 domain-containing protein [Nocardia farcinica]|uniref:DUF2505 domain-containing protein n=1 Tax=Nocardia farcinica TaxID=37329 RepID=UPI0018953175|nr:DUF2505 domain-containing protein [Nocardia farcinica]MBF6522310.1 DUF2505 domain-containing protein [Nocardia farcinica]
MSRKFRFTVPYSVPVEDLHRALTSDDAWQARFAEASTATLDISHLGGPGTARIHMTERARRDKIPALVSKVLAGELVFDRTDDWRPLTGGAAEGDFRVTTSGITATMAGIQRLRGTAQGSEIEVDGSLEVKVPLVGRAIEPLAEQLLHRVLGSERKFFEQWCAQTRS